MWEGTLNIGDNTMEVTLNYRGATYSKDVDVPKVDDKEVVE